MLNLLKKKPKIKPEDFPKPPPKAKEEGIPHSFFAIRRIPKGWIVEQIEVQIFDKSGRTRIVSRKALSEPNYRMHAVERFKAVVGRTFTPR